MKAFSHMILVGGLLAATPALLAQSQVFPTDHANLEGSTRDVNFGPSNGVNRTQIVFDKLDLVIPNGAQITRVGFRPDKDANNPGAMVQMEILMGHSDKIPWSRTSGTRVENTYSLNYLSGATTVFNLKVVNLPALTPTSPGPSTSPVMFTLDTPFIYDATKNLVVEFQVQQNNQGNSRFTYAFDQATNASTSRVIGTSCTTSNGRTPEVTAGQAQIGGSWQITVRDSLPNAGGILLLGDSSVSVPFGPAAPGCSLLVMPLVMVPLGTSSSGTASLTIPVPHENVFYGLEFYAQHLIVDIFANSAGFVTSDSAGTVFGRLPQMTYVERTNSYTSPTGSVRRESGPVMIFDWQ